jgi:hypothetical protein
MDIESYESLLRSFLSSGYKFIHFTQSPPAGRQLVMRHDIDFDIEAAHQIAEIEKKLGVVSSFFFMMCSDSYNILSQSNRSNVLKIAEMGHIVSIHFDPTIYADFQLGFRQEKAIFESTFGCLVSAISLHRPNDFFQNYNETIEKCCHTYMNKYFKDIYYVSDSGGEFRYGHPLDSSAFKSGEPMQVLTHPIWWISNGQTPQDKLSHYFQVKKQQLKTHYSANCKPFRDVAETLV